MADQNPRYDEKDEKSSEKEREKSEEKYRRDPLSAVIWAAILIWAGVVLLLDNLGYLESLKQMVQFEGPDWLIGGIGVWGLIFAGAGVILLLEVLARLLIPAYRRPVTGTIILAFVFIGIGLGNLISWNVVWPIILIAIGLSIVVRVLLGRR